ncbi:MAG: hypothetical protein K0R17_72 [Rariglobus sp.]|jgi:hypothetical protein|nr:hypothetical protein [Rariglobus sp.]
MAKKTASLSFRDIVLGADAEVIRQAHEARVQIDQLVEERQRAYERIAALETQVEDILGEPGAFPFPAPPLTVAGFDPKADAVTRGTGSAKKSARPSSPASAGEENADPADSASSEEN